MRQIGLYGGDDCHFSWAADEEVHEIEDIRYEPIYIYEVIIIRYGMYLRSQNLRLGKGGWTEIVRRPGFVKSPAKGIGIFSKFLSGHSKTTWTIL